MLRAERCVFGRAVLTLAWLCALTPRALHAQHAPTPPAPRVNAVSDASADSVYQARIADALEEFDRGNWAEARHHFLEAHERRPTARTMRGLGVVAFELRRYVESVGWLERALASTAVPLTDSQRGEVQVALERARGFVGRYELVLDPEQAEVRVDGAPLELHQDGALWLDVGEHELVVSATGYKTLTRKLSVQGGKLERLELTLQRPAPALALSSGHPKHHGGSVLGTWWFWSLAAVAIGGGASAAYVLTRPADVEPLLPGDEGVSVRALTIAR